MTSSSRVPDPSELAEDIHEIKEQLSALLIRLEQSYVPRELYEARHAGLRNEIALEFATLKAGQESTKSQADSARALALWCLGIIGTSVVVALVGFVATAGGSP